MKKKLFLALACLLLALGLALPASAAGTMQQGSFAAANDTAPLRYWLYVPEKAEEAVPLVVYLHGGSGRGDDLQTLLETDGFPQYLAQGRLGDLQAYVLIPQLPAQAKGWEEAGATLLALIDSLCQSEPIDASRVSLTGHSMGGTGVWALAAAYPQRFSCAAPLSGSVRRTPQTAAALAQLPIWALVGAQDTVVPPRASEAMAEQLQARGANARLSVFADASHTDVPALAYLDPELGLLDWLLAQRRTEPESKIVKNG